MKRTIAWIALFALTMGCASGPAPIGSKPLLAIDPAAVEGTWALTDERNQTFNVILREDGSATSTWSRGMDGAKGEQGGWSIRDGVLFVRWTDGWLDTIRAGRFGFEKFSYEPSKDFQPVAAIAEMPMILVVPKNSPAGSVQLSVVGRPESPGFFQ